MTLEASGSALQRTTITDEAGQFRFSDLTEGAHKLTITASGFAAWTAEAVAPSPDENFAAIRQCCEWLLRRTNWLKTR